MGIVGTPAPGSLWLLPETPTFCCSPTRSGCRISMQGAALIFKGQCLCDLNQCLRWKPLQGLQGRCFYGLIKKNHAPSILCAWMQSPAPCRLLREALWEWLPTTFGRVRAHAGQGHMLTKAHLLLHICAQSPSTRCPADNTGINKISISGLRKGANSQAWWGTPAIPVLQEAEAGDSKFDPSPDNLEI